MKTAPSSALVLANDLLRDPHAKTTHALVRGPSRYPIAGVIDASYAGEDAGELLDGRRRDIPVFASVDAALEAVDPAPTHCVIGVATSGGVLPPELRRDLLAAARAGLTLVNGLHRLLASDREIAELVAASGGRVIDVRAPKPAHQLRFWTGEGLEIDTPVVPILGTDCAAGKRTTTWLLQAALAARGVHAEPLYTGQTGWLQGAKHGFILDSTINDFVCGELEGAILECHRDSRPDLMLIEGQASLRNPSGPCGSELVVSTNARGVVLQHVPGRASYIDAPRVALPLAPIDGEIELVGLLGAEVWGVTLHEEGLTREEAADRRQELEEALGIPVALPLRGGAAIIADCVLEQLGIRGTEQPTT